MSFFRKHNVKASQFNFNSQQKEQDHHIHSVHHIKHKWLFQ